MTEPGSALDVLALETATVWHALASVMVEGPALSGEEANYVLARVVEVLGEVLPIATRTVADNPAVDLPQYGEARRDIGTAMRDMKP